MLTFVRGDMFETPADIRLNTVNCVGVMGAGVALAFKTRYPEMFRAYKKACDAGEVKPGALHVWKTLTEWIINFPTKRHWRDKSRYEDIAAGLTALRDYLSKAGAVRVVLPALGCGHGGLDWTRVSEMIRESLGDLEAQIFVFEPSDSVAAGEQVAAVKRAESPAIELSAEKLAKLPSDHPPPPPGWGVERLFVLGNPDLLAQGWLAILLSPSPDAREEAAALACVDAIARSGITTAIRYSGRVPRRLCETAVARGAKVILWAAEGIDHVDPPKSLQAEIERGRVAVVSVAKRAERWSAAGARRATLLQLELARAALITDPQPEWPPKQGRHAELPQGPKMFYVRYGNNEPPAIERLRHDGAHPVSRDAHTGLPKTAPVLAALGVA